MLLQRPRYTEIANFAAEIVAETDFHREMSLARKDREFERLKLIELRHCRWVESRVERLGEEIASYF